jgi:hypothetical protein
MCTYVYLRQGTTEKLDKAPNTASCFADTNKQQLGRHYYGKYWEWSYNTDTITQNLPQGY